MPFRRHAWLLAAIVLVVSCSGPPPAAESNQSIVPAAIPADNATTPAQVEADYTGKWTGPEGLVLDVKPKVGGGVTLVNQWTLDDKGNFDGSVTVEGLRFTRNGVAVTARPSDGDATGMKWLAGKKDCLTVTVGSEGYCRD